MHATRVAHRGRMSVDTQGKADETKDDEAKADEAESSSDEA